MSDNPTPTRQGTPLASHRNAQIEQMRRSHKWSAARIAHELEEQGSPLSRRTVSRYLAALDLKRSDLLHLDR